MKKSAFLFLLLTVAVLCFTSGCATVSELAPEKRQGENKSDEEKIFGKTGIDPVFRKDKKSGQSNECCGAFVVCF